MKFGLAFYPDILSVTNLAQAAEDAGWDGLFVGDAIWTTDPMMILAAAATATRRIRLGTMVIPVPLRRPWKIASESLALDLLSGGRAILGLGAGAVWMGWRWFPDEITDNRARVEMLDETIDILTLLYQRKAFEYQGKHYQVKMSPEDEMHFPPMPVQRPRIPLWAEGFWPRKNGMRRAIKCDGLLVNKIDGDGKYVEATPADLREMKAFVDANRTLTTPFDYVKEGATTGMSTAQAQDTLQPWVEAGATWWIEGLWGKSEAEVTQRIKQGPPLA
jgi:alkanesulfonate monooxygenase SsuD/methylene tetrahydromethanopterin reductase-like flavin-dependent oxidoreductase (luciferase family)